MPQRITIQQYGNEARNNKPRKLYDANLDIRNTPFWHRLTVGHHRMDFLSFLAEERIVITIWLPRRHREGVSQDVSFLD